MLNILVIVIGLVLLVCGTYVSIWQIMEEYAAGKVQGPFSCKSTDPSAPPTNT